ncbi:hypothetical protein [Cognatiyoonia sp. IB215182]|uniref:hypothetical protein n=1 Tax=Cognatiyoonia sp. IB215182 TaxID=3097353 RepID=UPI002A10A653|nr:hypothetical protein [Cognatiyoonia sp. IB215182]MDX8352819.1 hypothetical protein [Cognatiyoonia sp. IB215182]
MILSRILARKRIAAGMRPSIRAAWAPVAFDTCVIALILGVLFLPIVSLTLAMGLSLFWRIVFLMVAVYVPFQIVVVISTIWAIRSRWDENA